MLYVPHNKNFVEINVVDGCIMRALIDFIYTGSITINEHIVANLLSGAHYLQLNEVKQFCFEFLQSHVTIANLLSFLKIANVHNNKDLIEEMQQYVNINFHLVLETEDFKILSIEDLCSLIPSLDRSKIKEETIFKAIITWCNHDQEVRKTDFPQLFAKVNLKEVPPVYLKEIILEEAMVMNVNDCYKAALSAFHERVKEKNLTFQASKIIRLGGKHASPQVSVVYNLSTETPTTTYPCLLTIK